jgi:hypothetical protein
VTDERLEDLDPTPLAGPTKMSQAHANGLRKATAILKPWLGAAHKQLAAQAVRRVLRAYLEEWDKVYSEGVGHMGLTVTERSVLYVRADTVSQMLKELG